MGDCCVNILIFIDGQEYNLTMQRQVNVMTGEFIRYRFQDPYNINEPGLNTYLEYDDELGSWVMIDSQTNFTLFVADPSIPANCPASSSEDWVFEYERGEEFSFVIYEVECARGSEDTPDPYPIEEEEYFVPCTNGSLFKKQKAKLSKDIAAISKREVFGFDCGGEWENIFMRSLIIDALSCPPYDVIDKDTERCLIGKLNEKCNC